MCTMAHVDGQRTTSGSLYLSLSPPPRLFFEAGSLLFLLLCAQAILLCLPLPVGITPFSVCSVSWNHPLVCRFWGPHSSHHSERFLPRAISLALGMLFFHSNLRSINITPMEHLGKNKAEHPTKGIVAPWCWKALANCQLSFFLVFHIDSHWPTPGILYKRREIINPI